MAGVNDEPHRSTWALQALVHPVSLCCLAVLWLNDHVLKAAWPNWVTGKLSDVAGLALFPLVLALVVGLARRSPKITIVTSVLATGSWFTAFKTLPPVADATESLVQALTGQPARIVVDPTDLVALPALGWAMVAWRRPQAGAALSGPRFAVLFVAALLSLATSRYCPEGGPRDLTVFEPGVVVTDTRPSLMSVNAGRTWRSIDDVAARRLAARTPAEDRQCFSDNPSHCFRIGASLGDGSTVERPLDFGSQVEESLDGAVTWDPVWSYPLGRHRFVSRFEDAGCGYSVVAADLVVLDRPESVVLVAVSDHGIIRREANGEWTAPDLNMESVGLPTAALGHNIAPELTFAVTGAYVLFVVMSFGTWSRLQRRAPTGARSVHVYAASHGRMVWELGMAVGVALILVAAASIPLIRFVLFPVVVGAAVVGIVRLLWFVARWDEMARQDPLGDVIGSLCRRTGWSTVACSALVAAIALAWSGGLIATLEIAYGAMAVAAAAAVAIWRKMTRRVFLVLNSSPGDRAVSGSPDQ
jgi:hypothetical protein